MIVKLFPRRWPYITFQQYSRLQVFSDGNIYASQNAGSMKGSIRRERRVRGKAKKRRFVFPILMCWIKYKFGCEGEKYKKLQRSAATAGDTILIPKTVETRKTRSVWIPF